MFYTLVLLIYVCYSHSDPEYVGREYVGRFDQMNDNTGVSMQWMRMLVKAYDYIDGMREWGAMRRKNATDALELMSDDLTHHHLMATMQLKLDSIVEAREKLDAYYEQQRRRDEEYEQ